MMNKLTDVIMFLLYSASGIAAVAVLTLIFKVYVEVTKWVWGLW